jgi:hypothetical protein
MIGYSAKLADPAYRTHDRNAPGVRAGELVEISIHMLRRSATSNKHAINADSHQTTRHALGLFWADGGTSEDTV